MWIKWAIGNWWACSVVRHTHTHTTQSHGDELESGLVRTRARTHICLLWVIRFAGAWARASERAYVHLFIAYCLYDVVRMGDSIWINTNTHTPSISRWSREKAAAAAALMDVFAKKTRDSNHVRTEKRRRYNMLFFCSGVFCISKSSVLLDVLIWIEWLTDWLTE